MAKIVIEIHECKTQISSECTKTFQRSPGRGRPAISCPPCREAKKPVAKKAATYTVTEVPGERVCPCGTKFQVKPGRGRKAEKCDGCRDSGTAYRQNSEGVIEEIRAETIRREQAEILEQKGKDRAEALTDMMRPLHERDAKRRKAFA